MKISDNTSDRSDNVEIHRQTSLGKFLKPSTQTSVPNKKLVAQLELGF
jgi:hypothetical protein